MAIPLALIVVISVVDILAPPQVHMGPFLVAAPAITASFAGPRMTAFVGFVAVLAQMIIGASRTTLLDLNHTVQITALILISVVVTLFAHLRELHEKEITQLRSVADAAQQVVLRPLPRRMGPLRIASVYLAAEAEAQIGGDLYAAARTANGSRLIVGDVRGKGLEAIGDAALVLGAFRAAAHRQAALPALVAYLEGAVSSDLDDPEDLDDPDGSYGPDDGEGSDTAEGWGAREDPAADEKGGPVRADRGESFITAVVLDIPDAESAIHLVDCGHPPPILLRGGQVIPLQARQPAPPLGLTEFLGSGFVVETFAFEVGDMVLLYTDGVVEARDASGAFYPLMERMATWPAHDPQILLGHLCQELLAHAGGRLGDDAAMVAIQRLPTGVGRHAGRRERAGPRA
ncbi:PP2C family protein-serine/threonine phosphatase [Kitasatospora atroaurantiaca]|uniref:Serine phosphatase RsbU (Regulator of sigma subunit) n=1 Tax=Kitasatospora atroaurantiaca TaxID=285545 RepID=A0A561EJX8_9ACTN|nr:serine phosphatase RsbU (regulator of sigma subunit) [Kitasatospora atroaurantiaca]